MNPHLNRYIDLNDSTFNRRIRGVQIPLIKGVHHEIK
jgi:hypothetical protein